MTASDLRFKTVDKDAYHAYIQRFPWRVSTRTGIVGPPQEQCFVGDRLIGCIHLMEPFGPNRYRIRDESDA